MLQYRLVPLPTVWPGKRNTSTKRSPFKTRWTRTLELLERELKHLDARNIEIAVDVRSERDIRADGMLRADARPRHPVILSFTLPATSTWDITTQRNVIDRPERRLQFPCDTYGWWEDNVYAIAMALENLRAVERWGVSQTSQYEGFRALPASTAATMSTEDAAKILASHIGGSHEPLIASVDRARDAARLASARTHPDRGGSTFAFQRVQEATRALGAHFGTAL